jgi:hypothetical protein
MMLALSMITFSFFRATVEKKVKLFDLALYVLAVFFHTMSLVVIGICVIVTLLDAKKHFLRRIGFALVVGVVGVVFTRNFSNTVNQLYQKFQDYVLEEQYSDKWEYIMGALMIALLLMLAYEFRRLRREKEYRILKSYHAAMLWSMLIAVCFYFEFSIFYRFGGHLAVIFSIPVMMLTLEKSSGRPSRAIGKIDFKGILLLFSMVIALLSCTRGSLSSLKFFELGV